MAKPKIEAHCHHRKGSPFGDYCANGIDDFDFIDTRLLGKDQCAACEHYKPKRDKEKTK